MSAKPITPQSGPGGELPLELIDKIVESNRDEEDSLLASSCVSKLWRVASLRYLFSMAEFSYHEDFTRWRDIGSHLPQVPLFVKEVVFEPEGRFGPGRRFEFMEGDVISWPNRTDLLEEPESLSNPSDIKLPDMPRVHRLVWKTSSIPISCTPETRQFISTFSSLKEVEFEGRFATVSDAKEFLGLLPQIEVLNIEGIDIDEAGISGQSPAFTGDMTNLRRLSIEECETSLDWLVDDVLAVSCPANLQSIGYENSPPFSQKAFTRLVALSYKSLQELSIEPPRYDDQPGGWTNPPRFTNPSFPSLTSLAFCMIKLGRMPIHIMFSMNWCLRMIKVLPPAPEMTSLTMNFYSKDSEDIDETVVNQSFDWRKLSDLISERFPKLERFIVTLTMDFQTDMKAKASTEAILNERLHHFGKKLVIEWED
ncbi:hypothetical protein EV421DRAFT_2017505 [Armillaria borealis]|uniref:F-box domain-containing protein n=1 Tax=Armillaria borealis TaxID=47425 RepID=A0AA39JRK8_9AGAR|nr:hypothetical protein EV421DRAFT_2017505 [Armillaria borealis]